ncbi:hypothetical protein B0H14DRAFT_2606073 [Mycena olivaceomarginata]|nr:hypothetical protein B0H14DRAFT_2606073 [Mycena olivaceomarginata]
MNKALSALTNTEEKPSAFLSVERATDADKRRNRKSAITEPWTRPSPRWTTGNDCKASREVDDHRGLDFEYYHQVGIVIFSQAIFFLALNDIRSKPAGYSQAVQTAVMTKYVLKAIMIKINKHFAASLSGQTLYWF